MKKLPGRAKSAKDRYQEMAAAAAKRAASARSARDRAIYLTLAKGWEALAETVEAEPEAEKTARARKAKEKPRRG